MSTRDDINNKYVMVNLNGRMNNGTTKELQIIPKYFIQMVHGLNKVIAKLLLALPLFIYNYSYSQIDSVQIYYQYINKAELNIVDNDYVESKENYQKAFSFKKNNGKDLYNYFLVSFYLHDTINAKASLQKLAYSGLDRSRLMLDSNSQKNTKAYYDLVTSKFDSSYNVGRNYFDTFYIHQLEDIYNNDIYSRKNNSGILGLINHQDSLNLDRILTLIEQRGWPTFDKVGFWTINSSPRSEYEALSLIFWHNAEAVDIIEPIIIKYILKGDAMSEELMKYYLARKQYGYDFNYRNNAFLNIWNLSKIENEKKESIEVFRKSIYFDNLEDHLKKFKYQSTYNIDFGMPIEKCGFIFYSGELVPRQNLIDLGIFD